MLHQHIIESILKIIVTKKNYCFNLERTSLLWSSPGLCFLLNLFVLRKPEDRRPTSDSRRWPRRSSNFVFREGFDESEIIENLTDLMDLKLLKIWLIWWIWNYWNFYWFDESEIILNCFSFWCGWNFRWVNRFENVSYSLDFVKSCISFTKLFYCKI